MSEITFEATNLQIITARVEPNKLQGRDVAGIPMLYIPLQLQLIHGGQKRDVEYTIVRLAGTLQNQWLNEFAYFEVSPLALVPSTTPYFRQQDVLIGLDRARVRQFEDARDGREARFQVVLSCLVWYPSRLAFEMTRGSGPLDVIVPTSQWADTVVSKWGISRTRLVQIEFPTGETGDAFRTAYARVEEAEKFFLNGQYKQVLTGLRLSFEALAKGLGFERVGGELLESLFANFPEEKKQKACQALLNLYRFLHLGPHEQTDGPTISRQDARFALTMVFTVFEYITPRG